MSTSPIVRVALAVGGLIFLALALKMGAEAFHARSIGSSMSNWKGGTMGYEDGFKLAAIFAMFAVVWCYVAVRRKKKPNQAPEPTAPSGRGSS